MATDIDLGGNNLILESVSVGATSPGQSGTSLSSAELIYIDGITPGTAAASKAVVLDSGTKISGIKNVTLAAGTATVAPLVLTTGTNLTTATAGSLEFDGTDLYFTGTPASRQVIHTEQRILLTADHDLVDATIASATPVFVATGAATGAVALAATTTYGFEGVYRVTNTGTTSHTWSTLFGGTVGVTALTYLASATTSTGQALTAVSQIPVSVATAIVVTGASTSATENLTVMVRGNIITSTAGTLIPQILASARPGQTGTPGVTAKAGSFFRIWPVGAAASIVVGTWS